MAHHPPTLAANQLGHVRILLLGHDRRAGTEAVGQINEVELGGRPQHQLFREARQVHHGDAGPGGELDGEIPVADCVERILRDAAEAEQLGSAGAIDREGGAGKRGSPQRHDVHPPAAVGQPFPVPHEHLEIGQQVMAEGHGLGGLQVREAGHDGVGMGFRLVEQGRAQALQLCIQVVDLVTQPQADVGGHLVVAGAARVQLLAGIADQLGQARLDVHVHVFARDRPMEFAAFDLGADRFEPGNDLVPLCSGQHAGLFQHGGVGNRACHILPVEALVETDRCSKALHEGIRGFLEAPAPEFGLLVAHAVPDRLGAWLGCRWWARPPALMWRRMISELAWSSPSL